MKRIIMFVLIALFAVGIGSAAECEGEMNESCRNFNGDQSACLNHWGAEFGGTQCDWDDGFCIPERPCDPPLEPSSEIPEINASAIVAIIIVVAIAGFFVVKKK